MTLLHLRNQIVQHFCEHDTLTPDQFGRFEVSKDMEGRKTELVNTVLGDLAGAGMIRLLLGAMADPATGAPAKDPIWILTSPMGAAGQEVPITLPTAAAIADESAAFVDAYEEDWPVPDALSIGEHNVLMLLAIIARLRSEDCDEDDELGGPDGGAN